MHELQIVGHLFETESAEWRAIFSSDLRAGVRNSDHIVVGQQIGKFEDQDARIFGVNAHLLDGIATAVYENLEITQDIRQRRGHAFIGIQANARFVDGGSRHKSHGQRGRIGSGIDKFETAHIEAPLIDVEVQFGIIFVQDHIRDDGGLPALPAVGGRQVIGAGQFRVARPKMHAAPVSAGSPSDLNIVHAGLGYVHCVLHPFPGGGPAHEVAIGIDAIETAFDVHSVVAEGPAIVPGSVFSRRDVVVGHFGIEIGLPYPTQIVLGRIYNSGNRLRPVVGKRLVGVHLPKHRIDHALAEYAILRFQFLGQVH